MKTIAQADPAKPLANRRREAFCQALVSVPPPSQTKAYVMAGYSVKAAAQAAEKLLTFPHVLARVAWLREELYKRHGMTRAEMVAILAKQARASLGDYLDDAGRVDLAKVVAAGGASVVDLTVTEGEHGATVKIKIASQREAIETMAKLMGLFKDPGTTVNVAMDHRISLRDLRVHGEVDADTPGEG